MDRPAACGRGDGCYYCETSGSGHSVLRTINATKLFSSKPSLARRNYTIKVENNEVYACMCLFLLANFTRFVPANYCFLCFAKCEKKSMRNL